MVTTIDPLTGPRRPAGAVTPQLNGPDAVPVGESALLRALAASRGIGSAPAAVDLLNKVEAQLRAAAPPGMPAAALRAAAERLVAEQGLRERLEHADRSEAFAQLATPGPAVDTRL
jgi:hypothetical protein